MNSKITNSLASHMIAHWRNLNEEPRLGKMILVSFNVIGSDSFLNQTTTDIFDPIKDPHLEEINCVPIDINKYRFSVGYLDKPNVNEKRFSNTKIFVAKDYMYEDRPNFKLKRAPFTAIHFEKWIYLEELLYL